jgi:hypothetical protein
MVMVAYSFQKQFVPAIISGRKKQTIRAIGKRRHAQDGDMLQLYEGMRTKHCAKIIEDQKCIYALPISIFVDETIISAVAVGDYRDIAENREYMEEFARLDGFVNLEQMSLFWLQHHGVGMFNGVLIEW